MLEGETGTARAADDASPRQPAAKVFGVSRPTGLRVLGAAVLGLWAVWAVLSWLSAARFVTEKQFHSDLEAGRIRTWRLATELHPHRPWPPSGVGSWTYGTLAQRESDGLPATWDGRPFEAVVYWVDGDLAPVRFAGALPGGDPSALLADLQEAGVVQATPASFRPSSEDRGAPWGLAAFALGLLLVVGNTRPTRGTRWFWFWLLGVPLGLGAVAYAVVELLLPGGPPRVRDLRGGSRRRRLTGWEGLVLLVASIVVVAVAASVLRDVAGPFVVPGR